MTLPKARPIRRARTWDGKLPCSACGRRIAVRDDSDILEAHPDAKGRCPGGAQDVEVEPVQVIRRAAKPMLVIRRADVAAFLLDRAEQFADDDPCCAALADAARAVMRGDVEEAERTGALDGLYYRVGRMTGPTGRPGR